ncbi:GNAT family N-acetyltransferase [Planococcus sp. X10-3]|uniref:GNAT family N-acetyltransferase n=1 Tax=Planococcus sp. X10-3 TaxID=3061240 RepID=UPI003BAE984B
MELHQLREFSTTQITEFWNREIGDSFPLREELWEQNTFNDLNLIEEACVAFAEGGKLAGFIVAKRLLEHSEAKMQRDVGWIPCLLVGRDARRQNLGERLLRHAEEHFTQTGIKEIRLGRDPWHYFPGIPAEDAETADWFERRGYERESIESDLMREVKGQASYKLANPPEHFRVLEREDLPELIDFLALHFPGRWHYEALRYLETGAGGQEFVGFYIEGILKGFCRINDSASPLIAQNVYWSPLFDGTLGGIGPLGIDRSVRGRQYGLDLVKAAANELVRRGSDAIIIDWTQLVPFYEKLGFSVWKQYITMAKTLNSEKE